MRILTKSVNILPWFVRDQIRKIPFLSLLQRKMFDAFFQGSHFQYIINAGPAKGLQLEIHLPEDKLLWTGTWEKEITELVAARMDQGTIALDVGSHRGFFAGVMALAGAREVYCFEPNPENISNLETLCRLNSGLPLRVMPIAVAANDGTAAFSIMPENTMGKLTSSDFQKSAESEELLEVTVRSLDSLMHELNWKNIGLVKIDVEGAELAVLKGAVHLLDVCRPTLVIEVHTFDLLASCRSFLESRAYKVRVVESGPNVLDADSFRVCHLEALPVS